MATELPSVEDYLAGFFIFMTQNPSYPLNPDYPPDYCPCTNPLVAGPLHNLADAYGDLNRSVVLDVDVIPPSKDDPNSKEQIIIKDFRFHRDIGDPKSEAWERICANPDDYLTITGTFFPRFMTRYFSVRSHAMSPVSTEENKLGKSYKNPYQDVAEFLSEFCRKFKFSVI